jgi:hypothetical protein
VIQVTDRFKVRPDWLYMMPPNGHMSLIHGTLHLLVPTVPRAPRLPINFFFARFPKINASAALVPHQGQPD